MARIQILFLLLLCSSILRAQDSKPSSFDLGFSYSYNFSAADMAERYGNNIRGELSVNQYFGKSGLHVGMKLGFISGVKVKENIFASQLNSSGFLISDGGLPADLTLGQRGTILGIYANKNVLAINAEKGIYLFAGLGTGIFHHKINIKTIEGSTPQFQDDYTKGYDRRSVGPYVEQNLGVKFRMDRLKMDIDLTFLEGFTKNTRPLNYDSRTKDNTTRFDVLIGLRATYYLPLSINRTSGEDVYY